MFLNAVYTCLVISNHLGYFQMIFRNIQFELWFDFQKQFLILKKKDMIASIVFSMLIVGFIVWAEFGRQVSQLMRVGGNLHYRAYIHDLLVIESTLRVYFQSKARLFLVHLQLLPAIFSPIRLFLDDFQKNYLVYFQTYFQKTCTFSLVLFDLLAIESNRISYFQTRFRLYSVLFLTLFLDLVGIYFQISYYNKVNKKEG